MQSQQALADAPASATAVAFERSRTVFLGSLRFLLFAGCVSMQSACQPPTEGPSAPVAAPPVPAAQPVAPRTSRPTRRRNLDRAGNTRPWFPLLRGVARSPDQCRGPIVRHGVACAHDRAHTKPSADAGRKLLGNHTGEHVRIKTSAPVDSNREVFGGHGQRGLPQRALPRSPRHGYPTRDRRLKRTRRLRGDPDLRTVELKSGTSKRKAGSCNR